MIYKYKCFSPNIYKVYYNNLCFYKKNMMLTITYDGKSFKVDAPDNFVDEIETFELFSPLISYELFEC